MSWLNRSVYHTIINFCYRILTVLVYLTLGIDRTMSQALTPWFSIGICSHLSIGQVYPPDHD